MIITMIIIQCKEERAGQPSLVDVTTTFLRREVVSPSLSKSSRPFFPSKEGGGQPFHLSGEEAAALLDRRPFLRRQDVSPVQASGDHPVLMIDNDNNNYNHTMQGMREREKDRELVSLPLFRET